MRERGKLLRIVSVLVFLLPTIDGLRFLRGKFQKPDRQVRTSSGIVQGYMRRSVAKSNGFYYAFLGIPFAKPPVGPLRFQPPQPTDNWSGVLDGSKEGNGCIEFNLSNQDHFYVSGDEDCLYLNVFLKNNPNKIEEPLPVMVYIYGGAFMEGNSNVSILGPDFLVEKNIILVTLNYRIGPFGFLNTEDMASPGNYGLKDQNMVLRWIQKNIRNFGGDPDNVTIFGHSAGSASVHFHLFSPLSRGLFHRAIMESGSALGHWTAQQHPRNIAYLYGIANGITNPKDSHDLIRRLRAIDSASLKDSLTISVIMGMGLSTVHGLPFAPSAEPDHKDAFLTKSNWYEMLKNGEYYKVPVIMGVVSEEALYFTKLLTTARIFFSLYELDPRFYTPLEFARSAPDKGTEIGKAVRRFYFGLRGAFWTSKLDKIEKYVTADYFLRPIRRTALLMSKYSPVYFYYFSYDGALGNQGVLPNTLVPGSNRSIKGVAHSAELYYIFNKKDNFSNRKMDFLTRERMVQMWTDFAKYSNPTPRKLPLLDDVSWPLVSPENENRMKFLEINETLTVRDKFRDQKAIEFWDELFRKYTKIPKYSY